MNAPFDVAEQLGLDQVRRHRGAVEDDEGPLGARRRLVDGARDDVLAAAGLAADEHGQIGRRDALEHTEHLAHAHRASDHVAEGVARADRHLFGASLVGEELDTRLAHGDGRARVQQALFDHDVADAGAVQRAEIAQQPAFVGLAQLGVEARGVRVVDDHVIGRAGAEAHVRDPEDDALLGAGRRSSR